MLPTGDSSKTKPGRAPAYQVYASDFIATTNLMTAEQVGARDRLMAYQWVDGSLPDDDAILRRMALNCSRRALDAIKHLFPKCDDGRLRNVDLERYRDEKTKWRERSSAGGKKSAEVRAASKVWRTPHEAQGDDNAERF